MFRIHPRIPNTLSHFIKERHWHSGITTARLPAFDDTMSFLRLLLCIENINIRTWEHIAFIKHAVKKNIDCPAIWSDAPKALKLFVTLCMSIKTKTPTEPRTVFFLWATIRIAKAIRLFRGVFTIAFVVQKHRILVVLNAYLSHETPLILALHTAYLLKAQKCL